MEAKLLELESSIAQAKRAKALIEHALACQYPELSKCPNFRAALKARAADRPSQGMIRRQEVFGDGKQVSIRRSARRKRCRIGQ
jgi:hypothetical protein